MNRGGGVVFHHDKARSHSSLRELDSDVLRHLTYSSDLVLSDYHLFRSLEHHFRGKKFRIRGGL